ncbi:MAG: nucleotidyltransferase family protein [Defluviitaleaceae bacterium]|nr:nucleotidyltransferase family protein [Defluviitaleaceae bacterium]
MRVAGVIVEFNPFHNGHSEHLEETKKITGCEKIVAVMSGNFVQRGEPAICDKWRRVRMALNSGVDIVVEIPVPYVISGADYFARAGVQLLAAMGVDAISFGSESGDIDAIVKAGHLLADEPPMYKEALRMGLDSGLSFAAARGAALEACLGETPDLFTKPNNGLAMEYCKALRLIKSNIEIFTTHRQSGGASATKIRRAVHAGEALQNMPDSALNILEEARQKGEIASLDDYSEIFRFLLYSRDFVLGEGLENRFRKFCGDFSKISDLLNAVKTKRYTHTRLQRAALGVILGIGADEMAFFEKHGGVQYVRVLGFRKESENLLGEITKKATLPVITHGAAIDDVLVQSLLTSINSEAAAKMLAKELEVGDIYKCATGLRGGYRSERAIGMIVVG